MKKNEKNLGWKPIVIAFSNGESLKLSYDKNTRFHSLFEAACVFAKINDQERDLFGLSIFEDNFYCFLDLNAKVSKLDFKSLRKKSGIFKTSSELSVNGLLSSTNIPTIWFRVQYYVKPQTIKNRNAKIWYYEQIKQNLLNYKFLYREDVYFQLAGLALHIDFGNYSIMLRHDRYFDPRKYFPYWLVSRYGICYLLRHVPSLHQSHSDLSRQQALNLFLHLASLPNSNFNMHLCRLVERTPFASSSRIPVWIGIGPEGIIYHEENTGNFISVINRFPWTDVNKFSHKRRMLEVNLSQNRHLSLESVSSSQAYHLFFICQKMHMFQTASNIINAKSPENPERLKYRESYIFVDEEDLQKCQMSDFNQISFRSFMHGKYCHLSSEDYSSITSAVSVMNDEYLNYYSLPNRSQRHNPHPVNSTLIRSTIIDENMPPSPSQLFSSDCQHGFVNYSAFNGDEENIDCMNRKEVDCFQEIRLCERPSDSSQSPVTSGLGSSTSLTIHSLGSQPFIEFPPPPSCDEDSTPETEDYTLSTFAKQKSLTLQPSHLQSQQTKVTFSANFLKKRSAKAL